MSDDPPVIRLEQVGSTNSYLLEKHDSFFPGSLVYSWNQSEGRGRHGRRFVIENGHGLAASILLDPPRDIAPTWVSLLAGWALVQALRELGLHKVELKWPNDVMVGGSKLAGILVEGAPGGRLVVGTGVNVISAPVLAPPAVATSLAGHGISLTDAEAGLLRPWVSGLRGVIRETESMATEEWLGVWKPKLTSTTGTIGRTVRVDRPDGSSLQGIARGLGDDGGLIVVDEFSGETCVVHSGDVFYIERS